MFRLSRSEDLDFRCEDPTEEKGDGPCTGKVLVGSEGEKEKGNEETTVVSETVTGDRVGSWFSSVSSVSLRFLSRDTS